MTNQTIKQTNINTIITHLQYTICSTELFISELIDSIIYIPENQIITFPISLSLTDGSTLHLYTTYDSDDNQVYPDYHIELPIHEDIYLDQELSELHSSISNYIITSTNSNPTLNIEYFEYSPEENQHYPYQETITLSQVQPNFNPNNRYKETLKLNIQHFSASQPKEEPNMYTKSQLSKLKKADLIQIILDNQFTIPQPAQEISSPISITLPKFIHDSESISHQIQQDIDQQSKIKSAKSNIESIDRKLNFKPKYQQYKPTPEQANIIGAYYIKHPEQFPSHIQTPKNFSTLEQYTQHLYNKPLPIKLIDYLNKPKQTTPLHNITFKYYLSAKASQPTIESWYKLLDQGHHIQLTATKEHNFTNKLFTTKAALKAELQRRKAIYAISSSITKQFPTLTQSTLQTRMIDSDQTPQQYKESFYQLLAAKTKTFQDCPVYLFKQHLAEYKLYLQNLN